jgi:hypothetical protein
LRQSSTVLAAFGGVGHISGLVEAPWPHLQVVPGQGGDPRGWRWSRVADVTLRVIGHPNGAPGEAAMESLGLTAVTALIQLADRVTPQGEPVVAQVLGAGNLAPAGAFGVSQQLTSGQSRWEVTVSLTVHPPA